MGSMPEIMVDECNGLLFEAGNALQLRAKVIRMFKDEEIFGRTWHAARASFLNKYPAETNIERLRVIYAEASSTGSRKREPTHVGI